MLAGPYRAGPWPGLTLRGAAVLLGCAALLALELAVTGSPHQAWPDLVLLGVTALLPLLVATNVTQMPGAAAAVCGAYLLPRSLLSLAQPQIELPPLLLIPALVFDLSWWLRERPSRKRRRTPRPRLTRWRAALAGGLFGVVLCAVEPAFELLQRRDWSDNGFWPAIVVTGAVCAGVSALSRAS